MTDVFAFVEKLVSDTEGLKSIAVADRDGVAVLRAPASADMQPQDMQSEQILTTIFSLTTDQTTKVRLLGQCQSICLVHEDAVVLQGNFGPLVITLQAEKSANVTKLGGVLELLKQVLAPTKDVVSREIDNW
mmetsp:Transcript_19119/g.47806  ORF Transcript_19119/g.47806 Transcript_19119/m.47806 type:complete len:132 (+) Transcript_19119:116-511(+)|eukprot:g7827.t1